MYIRLQIPHFLGGSWNISHFPHVFWIPDFDFGHLAGEDAWQKHASSTRRRVRFFSWSITQDETSWWWVIPCYTLFRLPPYCQHIFIYILYILYIILYIYLYIYYILYLNIHCLTNRCSSAFLDIYRGFPIVFPWWSCRIFGPRSFGLWQPKSSQKNDVRWIFEQILEQKNYTLWWTNSLLLKMAQSK